MKTKHNYWMNLVTLLLLIAVVALNCTGCYARVSWGETEDSQEMTIDRFDVERDTLAAVDCYIITDTLTGVQYLYAEQHGSGVHPCRVGLWGAFYAPVPILANESS